MRLSYEEKRKLAVKGQLFDERGKLVTLMELDREEARKNKQPETEVDKQLQVLQKTMNAMMELASQSEANRQTIMEAMANIKLPTIQAPIVNIKPVIKLDDWTKIESEVTAYGDDGKIKKIMHTRIK